VADAVVEFHRRYDNRAPVLGKALLFGEELLTCVLGGVCSDVVKTLRSPRRHHPAGNPQSVPGGDAAPVHR
jgi:hypothetical protein